MQMIDSDGKFSASAMWLAGLGLSLIFSPVWWLFAHYDRMTQGMFAALADVVLWLYALQFPSFLKRISFYGLLLLVTGIYTAGALLMPDHLPKDSPTSVILWPFTLATIGFDHVAIRLWAKYVAPEEG